jgi:hypothetical protein
VSSPTELTHYGAVSVLFAPYQPANFPPPNISLCTPVFPTSLLLRPPAGLSLPSHTSQQRGTHFEFTIFASLKVGNNFLSNQTRSEGIHEGGGPIPACSISKLESIWCEWTKCSIYENFRYGPLVVHQRSDCESFHLVPLCKYVPVYVCLSESQSFSFSARAGISRRRCRWFPARCYTSAWHDQADQKHLTLPTTRSIC